MVTVHGLSCFSLPKHCWSACVTQNGDTMRKNTRGWKWLSVCNEIRKVFSVDRCQTGQLVSLCDCVQRWIIPFECACPRPSRFQSKASKLQRRIAHQRSIQVKCPGIRFRFGQAGPGKTKENAIIHECFPQKPWASPAFYDVEFMHIFFVWVLLGKIPCVQVHWHYRGGKKWRGTTTVRQYKFPTRPITSFPFFSASVPYCLNQSEPKKSRSQFSQTSGERRKFLFFFLCELRHSADSLGNAGVNPKRERKVSSFFLSFFWKREVG